MSPLIRCRLFILCEYDLSITKLCAIEHSMYVYICGDMTARNWCFTSFSLDLNCVQLHAELPANMKYLILGEEKCPTTGRLHGQGYVEFRTPVRMTQVKKILGDPSVHLEIRKGSRQQAIDYCKKDGKYSENPEPPPVLIDCPHRAWHRVRVHAIMTGEEPLDVPEPPKCFYSANLCLHCFRKCIPWNRPIGGCGDL